MDLLRYRYSGTYAVSLILNTNRRLPYKLYTEVLNFYIVSCLLPICKTTYNKNIMSNGIPFSENIEQQNKNIVGQLK